MKTKYKVEDYIGKKIGKRTILEAAGRDKHGCKLVKVVCDCGKEDIVYFNTLVLGRGKQCTECQHKEQLVENGYQKLHAREFNLWTSMIYRCYSENSPSYKYYGAKGIKVCDEWRYNFKAFCEWSLSHGYRDDLTIDRIDSNGDYCPENCRWVTMQVQVSRRGLFKKNTSGYTGIRQARHHKPNIGWTATIVFKRKSKYLGTYSNKKDAVEARNKYIIENNLTEYPIQEWVG